MRFRLRSFLGFAFVLASAPSALAVQSWYDYYLQAKESDIPDRRWSDCVANLRAALRLRPASALQVRTYGLAFVDYLPHYHLGVCLLRQDKWDDAQKEFDLEEKVGAIKRTPYYAELQRLRGEARNSSAAAAARQAREEVDRLFAAAEEQRKRKAWDEADTTLVKAVAIAKGLDVDTLAKVTRARGRIATEREMARQAAERRQQIDQLETLIAEGQRLLEQGKPSEAKLVFDEAYKIDRTDSRVGEGRRVAEERILATRTRETLKRSLAEGKALFDAGQYEPALGPLTDAAADPENVEARALIARARQIIDGLRQQRELQTEIDRRMGQGEELMKQRRYPEAVVSFESVLRLDAGHAKARERKEEAERRTGEALFERWLPNQEPTLEVFEPEEAILDSPSLTLQGVATDDRGIQKVEFRVGRELVGEVVPPPPPAEPTRSKLFTREVPLRPGPNLISVTAFDTGGLAHTISFSIERRLRFHETPYFLPSALAGAVSLLGLGWAGQRVRRRRAMRRRFNPYIAGAPVLDDDMFYGRDRLTERMLSTLQRNSLMITGERRIGKTTFLHHLKRALEEDETGEWKFYPAFVDLQGVAEQAFFHALMSEIVEALSISPSTRSGLHFQSEKEDYEARDFSHDLPPVLAELKTRTDKKVKLALLIDEVDVLNGYSETVNQRLRGIFMKSFSENLVAVMSGVAIRRRWQSEVSPWYNFFDEIELPPFSREEAEALIREPVAGVFRFEPRAVDRIIELSQLRPYLVQKYCVHAVAQMLDQGRSTIRLSDVEAARATVEVEGRGGRQSDPAFDQPVAD